MRRIVVLGTGTGVGKTFVAAHLVRALGARTGQRVTGLKPIETGCSDGRAADAAELGSPCPPLHAFADPVSPHLAARRAGSSIRAADVARWVDEIALSISSYIVIVETAGGALSPLSEAETNLDLARALEPAELVLVAPDALGVLHDVRATWTAMRTLHRAPDQLVLSRARPPDASTDTNAAELERLGFGPVLDLAGLVEALG
jgi:dethiobiotin synthetase